jgi:hypothetical protein
MRKFVTKQTKTPSPTIKKSDDLPVSEADLRMIDYADAVKLLRVTKRTIRRRVAKGRYLAYGDGSGRKLLLSSIWADIQRQIGKVQ